MEINLVCARCNCSINHNVMMDSNKDIIVELRDCICVEDRLLNAYSEGYDSGYENGHEDRSDERE